MTTIEASTTLGAEPWATRSSPRCPPATTGP